MRFFGREPRPKRENKEQELERPSIFINQAKIISNPKLIDGIYEATFFVHGGRPRNEASGQVSVRITPDQLERINQNDGYINPGGELGLIKDDIGLITPEAKLLIS